MCRSESKEHTVNVVREDITSDDELFIGVIGTSGKENLKDWNMTLEINDKKVTLKQDTGEQCNVMPLQIYKGLTKDKITKSGTKLVSYSGHKMKTIGKNIFVVAYKEKLHPVEFQVIHQEGAVPVLGLSTCMEMDLVKRIYEVNTDENAHPPGDQSYKATLIFRNANAATTKSQEDRIPQTQAKEIVEEYADVFKGLGCLDGDYHIQIDGSVAPVVHPPRKVPFALKERLKAEVDRMETIGAIKNVTEPTEWVSSIVITEKKDGKILVFRPE